MMNSSEEEHAMPLEALIAGAIEQVGTDANEILVGQRVAIRANPGLGEHALVNQLTTCGLPVKQRIARRKIRQSEYHHPASGEVSG